MPQSKQREAAPGIHSESPSAFAARPQVVLKSLAGHGAGRLAAKRVVFLVEYRRYFPAKCVHIERRQIRYQAMSRQDQQTFAMRIEKRHHGLFVRSIEVAVFAFRAAFVAICKGGLVAVMSI